MVNKDIIKLFKGIGVIIDDSFGNKTSKKDKIWNIKSYFEKKNFPILTFSALPSEEQIEHLRSISFIILDWNLTGVEGIDLSDELINDNIEFIRKIKEVCFSPIFIFTNEGHDDVINALSNKGLYNRNLTTNHIFVKNKDDLKNSQTLFSELANWVKRTPSIYVLKEWDYNVSKAISILFNDLYQISPSWPYILSKNYSNDIGVDISEGNNEICDLINRNLFSRCSPISLNHVLISKKKHGITKEEIRKILECERFLKNNYLPNFPVMGDIFKIGKKYLINIRPDCDIVRVDNPELYCIEGEKINEDKINKRDSRYVFKHGAFREQIDFTIVPFIDGGKIIEFKFKKLTHKEWNSIKDKRIGRLLPPYITKLKLQYIAYLQRQGVSSIPDNAIK